MSQTSALETWQRLGWCGVIFNAPGEWRIGSIEKDYLLLFDGVGPVMEVKLGRGGRRFSHQDYLRRIRQGNRKRAGHKLQAYPIPPDWQNALRRKDVSGFHWQGETMAGKGIIIYEAQSDRVALIQFHIRDTSEYKAVYPVILASFSHQPQTDPFIWSVFHLRAAIPPVLALAQFRFEAGYQEMNFRQKHQSIVLYCWGAAETLLAKDDLIAFAAARLALPKAEPAEITDNSGNIVRDWSYSAAGFEKIRRCLLLKQPSCHRVRVWHVRAHNRILGAAGMGSRPFATNMFENICAEYGCV